MKEGQGRWDINSEWRAEVGGNFMVEEDLKNICAPLRIL